MLHTQPQLEGDKLRSTVIQRWGQIRAEEETRQVQLLFKILRSLESQSGSIGPSFGESVPDSPT